LLVLVSRGVKNYNFH